MQAVLEAVVEPRRREILRLVRTAESTAGSIAAHFPDVSRPTVSQHLRVLRDAGLLHERRDGTRRLYRARPEGFAEARAFFEEFWDSRLSTLKVEAEREQRRRDAHRND
ncbi:ArsR/SmtB family transcription factor [Pseudonocardia acaciae]|uniref:ArsR/SmtB family transcription factor n=1 Tax=Pseudonocardia acaciae TaxID=551276 RepID=UPI00048DF121|nr:metalloregulator ArsR/SmtB family transcription factor [Pseudonocardia acaciae]